MSFAQEPCGREDEKIRKAFAEKDAEIDRLKAALEAVDDHGRALLFMETLKAKNKLIGELADALFDMAPDPYDDFFGPLIQRAREVTREA